MCTVSDEKLTALQFLPYGYLNKTEAVLEAIERGDVRGPVGLKMTIALVNAIPILRLYPFMQRFLVKDIIMDAVKG